jgi:hypothetical protein
VFVFGRSELGWEGRVMIRGRRNSRRELFDEMVSGPSPTSASDDFGMYGTRGMPRIDDVVPMR